MRRVFEKFDSNKNIWRASVSCIAILDALLSLVSVSSLPNYNWAQVIPRQFNTNAPQFNVVGGRHPMLEQTLAERYFIIHLFIYFYIYNLFIYNLMII